MFGRVSLIALSLALLASSASAVTILPDPSTIIDGVPVAVPYDDFFSYAAKLLVALDPMTPLDLSGFNTSAGTGHLDILLYAGAGGAKNDPVADGQTFEDPVDAPGGSVHTFSGLWGAGLGPHGPVTVDQVAAYLHHQFGPAANVPVFTFDLVEPGSVAERDLKLVAKFSVVDPMGPGLGDDVEIAAWALDSTPNHLFDPASFLTVPGELTVVGTSQTYTVDTTGSGKADFVIFSPTMDLSPYLGHGYEFHAFLSLDDIDGGPEEAFISGGIAAPGTPIIPEPSSLALVSLGGLGFLRRRLRRV